MEQNGQSKRIIELGEADIVGLHKTWGIKRLVAELAESGVVERELGYDEMDRLVHRWPEGEAKAERGIFDLSVFDSSTQADLTPPDFERIWQEAIEEEKFFAENDPYGDRFGTSPPWWGCLLVLTVIAAGLYVFIF